MDSSQLRRQGLAARRALSPEQRRDFSRLITARLQAMPEYRAAHTVMLYRATAGEVSTQGLEGKSFAYPRCIDGSRMEALIPESASAWEKGAFGIPEPVPELSRQLKPEDIDLVICPCSAFDPDCRRLGMGKGYYDRFLPRCINAAFIALAFECQKVCGLSSQSWDVPMDMVITEKAVYRNPRPGAFKLPSGE